MRSRERVFRVLNGQGPDRVPIIPKIWVDLAANIMGVPFAELLRDPELAMRTVVRAALKVRADGARLFIFPRRLIDVRDEEYYEVSAEGTNIGLVDIQGGWATQLDDDSSYDLSNEDIIANNHLWRTTAPAIQGHDDIARMVVPPATYYEQAGYGKMVEGIKAEVDESICLIGDADSGTLAFHCALRGVSQGLLDLAEEPELVHASMEKGIEISIERAKFFLQHGIKVIRYNDSIANMSVISPRHWREFILPPLRAFCAEVHKYDREAKIYCHICGNVMPVIGDLAQSGLDCIAPLDPLGKFTVGEARAKVGDDFALMGGINTLTFLDEEPSHIIAEAKKCINEGAGSGRFILGSGCVVPRDANPENLAVLHEVVERFGRYESNAMVQPTERS
jgi:uroporphyrinogen-III decarboxylase